MSNPYILNTGCLPDGHHDSDGQTYLRHVHARMNREDGRMFRELSKGHPNLGMQIFNFLQDDFRCVFTFDRLKNSPHTDAIIQLLSLGSDSAGKGTHRGIDEPLNFVDFEKKFQALVFSNEWELEQLDRVVHALGLDVFTPPHPLAGPRNLRETRFGYMIVPGLNARREATETFVLYKTAPLRRLVRAMALWTPLQRGYTDTLTYLLRLVGTWDDTRDDLEIMLVHGLFGEVPPDIGLSRCTNVAALAKFDKYRKHSDSYDTFRNIWIDFTQM